MLEGIKHTISKYKHAWRSQAHNAYLNIFLAPIQSLKRHNQDMKYNQNHNILQIRDINKNTVKYTISNTYPNSLDGV